MPQARNGSRRVRERQLHYRLMRRIYALCRNAEWTLRYAPLRGNAKVCERVGLVHADGTVRADTVGTVDVDESRITVDYRYDVIATFLHECLHALLDDEFPPSRHAAEEREVQRLERLMLRHLSPTQARRIHLLMADLLMRGEDPRYDRTGAEDDN